MTSGNTHSQYQENTKLGIQNREENLATTPNTELEGKTTNPIGKILAIWGSILQTPLFFGLIYSLNRLIDTFQMMILFFGMGDPLAIAGAVSIAENQIITGCLLSIPGLIISLYVLIKTDYRSKLLFGFNIIASIMWIFSIVIISYLDLTIFF